MTPADTLRRFADAIAENPCKPGETYYVMLPDGTVHKVEMIPTEPQSGYRPPSKPKRVRKSFIKPF